jgi:hypothetical protein
VNSRASDGIAARVGALLVALSATGKSVSILEGVSGIERCRLKEVAAEVGEVVPEDCAVRIACVVAARSVELDCGDEVGAELGARSVPGERDETHNLKASASRATTRPRELSRRTCIRTPSLFPANQPAPSAHPDFERVPETQQPCPQPLPLARESTFKTSQTCRFR